MRRRVVPLAPVVDASTHFNGEQDGIGKRHGSAGVLDEGFGGEAQIHAALLHQTEGVGVAVKPLIAIEMVVLYDLIGMAPVHEVFLDLDAFAMFADYAFALVALKRSDRARKNGGTDAAAGRALDDAATWILRRGRRFHSAGDGALVIDLSVRGFGCASDERRRPGPSDDDFGSVGLRLWNLRHNREVREFGDVRQFGGLFCGGKGALEL